MRLGCHSCTLSPLPTSPPRCCKAEGGDAGKRCVRAMAPPQTPPHSCTYASHRAGQVLDPTITPTAMTTGGCLWARSCTGAAPDASWSDSGWSGSGSGQSCQAQGCLNHARPYEMQHLYMPNTCMLGPHQAARPARGHHLPIKWQPGRPKDFLVRYATTVGAPAQASRPLHMVAKEQLGKTSLILHPQTLTLGSRAQPQDSSNAGHENTGQEPARLGLHCLFQCLS